MASFLTDRLTRTILDGTFAWSLSPDLKVILVDQQPTRYEPTPNVPYAGGIGPIVDVEATVAGYARQPGTGANASTSFGSHTSTALLDDVIFPTLGEAGDRIAGAWVVVDDDDDDDTAWALAFLDFQDDDDLGIELTGGDFVLHFSTGSLFRIAKSA